MSRKTIAWVSILALLAILLCGGGGAAFWYLKYGPGAKVADVGPMPGRALVLPADAGFLAGFDVKGLFASASYKQVLSGEITNPGQKLSPEDAEKAKKELRDGIEQGLKQAEQKTGVRFDRDVERLVVGVWSVSAPTPDGALIALGHFDREKVTRAVEASAKADGATVSTKTVANVSMQVLAEAGKPGVGLAFLDESTLVVGTEGGVTAVVTNYAKHLRPFEANTSALPLVKGLDPASSYWIVVDGTVMGRADKETGGASPLPLPRSLTLAGKFDGGLELAGEMADEAAAKGASEMLQGGLGMARMQLEQNPDVQKVPGAKALVEGIKVKTEGKRITISVPAGSGTGLAGVVAAVALPSLMQARAAAGAASAAADMQSPADTPSPESESPEPLPSASEVPAPEPSVAAPTRAPAPRPTRRPTPRPVPTKPVVAAPPPAPAPTTPAGPLRVGGTISEPKRVHYVKPTYPDIAKRARAQGIVIMECTISAQGRVTDVKVLRGIPLLDQAAVDAVKQWAYEPTLLNGVTVPVLMTVTVHFKLD